MAQGRDQLSPSRPRPAGSSVGLWPLFRVFMTIGATAFGGGASAHIHHAVVERERWLDEERFVEGMTIARVLPGTNVSNLAAFVGASLAGYRGAAVAVLGVVAPGALVILGLAVAYGHLDLSNPRLMHALRGLGAGAVGIMVALVARAGWPLRRSPAGLGCAGAAFGAVAVLGWSVLVVLVALTPLASWLTARESTRPR